MSYRVVEGFQMDAPSLKSVFIRLLLFAVAIGSFVCAESPPGGGTGERSSKTHTRLIPAYSIERKTRLKTGLMVHVSIAPSDVQEEKLVALAGKLAEKHRKEQAFFLFIFDDAKGAREYEFASVEVRSAQNSLRAMYSFVRPDTQAHFAWYPIRGDKTQVRKIDLDPPPYSK